MYRRVTRAMSTSRLSGNLNPQVTDAANLPVTQSLLGASNPSSASASSHASTPSSSSISGSHPSSIIASTSTSPSVPTDILQCILDALKIQQQQFDRQYELLESRSLAQQRRDAILLHHLQLMSPPQITELAPNPFDTFVADTFVAASLPKPAPASTTTPSLPSPPSPPSVPAPVFDPVSTLSAASSSHVLDLIRYPLDEFPLASPSTTFVTKSEVKELTFPEFTKPLGFEAWYNMAMCAVAFIPQKISRFSISLPTSTGIFYRWICSMKLKSLLRTYGYACTIKCT